MKRYVIGDIHGCFKTFEKLLSEKIRLTETDELYLLGDYIDRGPRNKEVLDYIIDLKNKDFQIYPLRGNHEQYLVRDYEFSQLRINNHKLRDLISSKDLINEKGGIDERYMQFVKGLPFYYELEDFILVHAGLNFDLSNPLEDEESMMYVRGFKYEAEKIGRKGLIHGHTPIKIQEIQRDVESYGEHGVINLDNGCAMKYTKNIAETENYGFLCCLELNSMELIIQKNID